MIRADRRSVLKSSFALAALSVMPGALQARETAPALMVYDARFAVSRELAAHWLARGVPVLDPRDHDLGIAWRDYIPGLLAKGGGIEGTTLWSDQFICEAHGSDHGLRLLRSGNAVPEAAAGALRTWRLL